MQHLTATCQLLLLGGLLLALPANAAAQRNPLVDMLDSPVKVDAEVYNAGEVVECSVAFPGTAALFGVDTAPQAPTNSFLVHELFGAFRTWKLDSACNITSTWTTQLAAVSMTGIAVPNGDRPLTYWAVDSQGAVIEEFAMGLGTPMGSEVPMMGGLMYGPLVIDDHQAGQIGCYNDIVNDRYTCVDMNDSGAFVCQYGNANDGGMGAFGNSIGDAFDTSTCSGATLVQATGWPDEGQVTRVGQYSCGIRDTACANQWDVSPFSTFTNDIDEFECGGEAGLIMVDAAGGNVFILKKPVGVADCQDSDANMDTFWLNASQGGAFFTVGIDTHAPISSAMQRTPLGNGKYIFHLNAGSPSSGTVSPLFDLGDQCFPFVGGSPVVVQNNLGKTHLVGQSSYFGNQEPPPARAPTFVRPTDAVVDTFNMPSGSEFTGHSIHVNGGASSAKGGSLSNAIIYDMR